MFNLFGYKFTIQIQLRIIEQFYLHKGGLITFSASIIFLSPYPQTLKEASPYILKKFLK